mmetsp:Transcript_71989/g.150395  ORF Transcript_71989/g.150395 Transcript_71989/m.150395 type:complete len:242 (+) Transcript_71989:287-1012(+)
MAAAGVSANRRVTSLCEILPLPSASQLRKAALRADSERASPSFTAAASHSVYSSSWDPSVSRESKTESTQLATSPIPVSDFMIEAANSCLLILPFLSSSQAKNCSRRSSRLSVASCVARAVSIARCRIEPFWKCEKLLIKFLTWLAGTALWWSSPLSQGLLKAFPAVSLFFGSIVNNPCSSSFAGLETMLYSSMEKSMGSKPILTSSSGSPPKRRVCSTTPALHRSEAGVTSMPDRTSGAM